LTNTIGLSTFQNWTLPSARPSSAKPLTREVSGPEGVSSPNPASSQIFSGPQYPTLNFPGNSPGLMRVDDFCVARRLSRRLLHFRQPCCSTHTHHLLNNISTFCTRTTIHSPTVTFSRCEVQGVRRRTHSQLPGSSRRAKLGFDGGRGY